MDKGRREKGRWTSSIHKILIITILHKGINFFIKRTFV